MSNSYCLDPYHTQHFVRPLLGSNCCICFFKKVVTAKWVHYHYGLKISEDLKLEQSILCTDLKICLKGQDSHYACQFIKNIYLKGIE